MTFPEEPLHSGWLSASPEDFEDTLRSTPENLCSFLLQSLNTVESLWITVYPRRSYFHPQLFLLLQDTRKYSSTFQNPFSDCLAALFRLNNPTKNSSHLSGIRSSPVDHMSHKILRMQFDLPKILCSLVLPKVLSACIMVKSICPTIFINILCHCYPEPIDSLCCDCSQSSVEP